MGSLIEKDRRGAFHLNIFRQFGSSLFRIHDQRTNGKIILYDPNEIIGEVPSSEVPGQVVFDKTDMDLPNQRLEDLKANARAKKMRIVIAATTGVVTSVLIGTYFVLKHHIDINPHSDITDK